MNRRAVLTSALLGALPRVPALAADRRRRPRVILRSSWQVVNIGDVGHTPGVLALMEKHVPEAEVVLWASQDLSPEVARMLGRRFPRLRIVKGKIDAQGTASNPDLEEVIGWGDFLLHGSGPSMVGRPDVAAFHDRTGKPFGVYGITYGGLFGTHERELLGKAQFAFFRDTPSLERARADGVSSPLLGFAPDGAFAVDLRADARARAYLAKNGLAPGKFLVTIPRLRYTPYFKIRNTPMTDQDRQRWERSQAMKESDHAKLREAIVAFVRGTRMKVLVCPEDSSQMEVGRECILDKLPEDVRRRTVWRPDFWLTDEAVSVYERAFALLSLEMHSPIMALGRGVPTVLCRFEEQTSKGFMWRDIGLGDWLFDLDEEKDGARITAALMGIVENPRAARAKAAKALAFVREKQRETMAVVRRSLGLG